MYEISTSFPGSLFSASLSHWNRDPGCGWSRDHPGRDPERQNAAGHNSFRIWCVVNEMTVSTLKQQAELLGSSSHEEQTENVGKPCVDQKNGVELSDIEILASSLFYCHFPSLLYFCICK